MVICDGGSLTLSGSQNNVSQEYSGPNVSALSIEEIPKAMVGLSGIRLIGDINGDATSLNHIAYVLTRESH